MLHSLDFVNHIKQILFQSPKGESHLCYITVNRHDPHQIGSFNLLRENLIFATLLPNFPMLSVSIYCFNLLRENLIFATIAGRILNRPLTSFQSPKGESHLCYFENAEIASIEQEGFNLLRENLIFATATLEIQS